MSPPGEQRLTYPLPQDAPERGCRYDIHASPSSSPPLQSPSYTPMSNLTPQTTPIPPRECARVPTSAPPTHPHSIPAPWEHHPECAGPPFWGRSNMDIVCETQPRCPSSPHDTQPTLAFPRPSCCHTQENSPKNQLVLAGMERFHCSSFGSLQAAGQDPKRCGCCTRSLQG